MAPTDPGGLLTRAAWQPREGRPTIAHHDKRHFRRGG